MFKSMNEWEPSLKIIEINFLCFLLRIFCNRKQRKSEYIVCLFAGDFNHELSPMEASNKECA